MEIELFLMSYLPYIVVFLNISMVIFFMFTIYNAKNIVKNRQNYFEDYSDFDYEIKNNDDEDEEDGISNMNVEFKNIKENFANELDEAYSFISDEYKDTHFQSQLIENRRDSSSSASSTPSRSRSNSQALVQTMLHLLVNNETGKDDMDVGDALEMLDHDLDREPEENRRTSWPLLRRIKKQESRLGSLQSINE